MTSSADHLRTLRDCIRHACAELTRAEVFFGHGTDNAWDEAVALVQHVAAVPFEHLNVCLDARLAESERVAFRQLLERRIQSRQPLPYLTGRARFCGLEFEVTRDTLIPRSPIAELIEGQFSPLLPAPPERILDLCAGGGCIGIAAALAFPDSEVVLADISAAALAVAERNVARYRLGERVRLVQGDLFDGLSGERFDLIICNPPYVDAEDMAALPAEYRAEPELALASGADGLDFTRRLLREARAHLSAEGLLVVEVGNSAPALEAAFPELPFMWLEFERGGDGVFALNAAELP